MKKTRVLKRCLICGGEFWKNICRLKIGKGKYCSTKCYGMSRKGKVAWNKGKRGIIVSRFRGVRRPELAGENHWNWKGGISKTTRLDDVLWNNTRKIVYARDNWSCRRCGKKCHNDIQCHHIIPYRRCNGNPEKPIFWNVCVDDTPNLVTLCKSCHVIVEKEVVRRESEGDYGFQTVFLVAPAS